MPKFDIAFLRAPNLRQASETRIGKGSTYPMHLSARECEILDLIYTGNTNAQIASALDINLSTLENHQDRIFQKVHVRTCAEAATKYAKMLRELRRNVSL